MESQLWIFPKEINVVLYGYLCISQVTTRKSEKEVFDLRLLRDLRADKYNRVVRSSKEPVKWHENNEGYR
jgi:hypothetical protein